MTARLRFERRPDGKWYWELFAGNGERLAYGAKGYTRQTNCIRAAKDKVLPAMKEAANVDT